MQFVDGPTHDLSLHPYKATLSGRYPRYGPAVNRCMVRSLQRRYVLSLFPQGSIHCSRPANPDTDVLFWEGDPSDPTRKPPEMRQLIENFCLGTRRLELFARGRDLAPGWVGALTAGEVSRLPSTGDAGELRVEVDETGNETLVRVGARRWERAAWDEEVAKYAGGGKAVVPMSSGELIFLVFLFLFCLQC
jgi:hypothetical protein